MLHFMAVWLSEERNPAGARRGFILYIVMAVLLALAILAFALNSFKQGTVTQLARTVDQNRLALLAQSANAEVVAMIRSQVNSDSSSEIFSACRSVFPRDGIIPVLNSDIVLANGFQPQQTLQMAHSAGYPLLIKSRAVLKVYRKAEYTSVSAFNGYLDVYSQARREGAEENVIEAHQRHDVRLLDLRHNLDKYALFVKNYSPDYNNTSRRIIVKGITPTGAHISRVYLGNANYPDCRDSEKNLWLDLNYAEHCALPGFAELFNFSVLQKFPGGSGTVSLFSFKETQFSSLSGITVAQFFKVKAVMRIYEIFVNDAADGCVGQRQDFKTGDALKKKCTDAKKSPKTNSNSAGYQICDDFEKNAVGLNYSKCSGFKKILNTCIVEWKYHHGYTDAASIWDIDHPDFQRPKLPNPRNWVTALAYKGLSELSDEFGKKGPFFNAYLDEQGDGTSEPVDSGKKIYNPERLRVGRMLRLYGPDDRPEYRIPVLVEGPAFLRFFKIAYLDTFKKQIDFFDQQKDVIPEPVPLMFRRPKLEPNFLNTELGNQLAASPYFSDKMMMSRAIDNVSVNALLGKSLTFYDGERKSVTINPLTAPAETFLYPVQKPSETLVSATKFGRLVDFKTASFNYPSPEEFVKNRVAVTEGKKVMFLDGLIYIEEGDLDISDVHYYCGKGIIYLGRGDCLVGNLSRLRDQVKTNDSLRIYLRQGQYRIKDPNDHVKIEASLAAFYNPHGSTEPNRIGTLLPNRKKEIVIYGNLLLDYLYVQDTSNTGLEKDGRLVIEHDPLLYEPALEVDGKKMDPYHISIGPVKTSFSINAGGKTF